MSGASALPDELWRRILEIGIESSNFTYKDLCCLSITCTRLNRLSSDDSLWSSLFSTDFPQYHINQHPSSSSSKSLYKIRYLYIREQKLLAHRRAVLRIQSEINEHSRRIREMELRSAEEKEKMKNTVAELLNLRKIRQASVALNVWQPEVVRGRQKQMVEQCNVPIDNRIHAIEMELKLCKQQILGFEKALRVEKKRMQTAKEKLASVEYHPLRDFNLTVSPVDEHDMRGKRSKHMIKGNLEKM
ncbi:F-box protein SKIP24-like isoform X1 [Lycium ferocissimum]|uniref:F-box protein SKIP24-like isoform X1 n=1 Tax=Lycium ferocissimum TaxID=112874 RepID=UPI0028155817|nr:F-box protein SKIP24-like isoform X1 [Lycium ferocissimum]